MSSPLVRRLTAVLALTAVLCLATPPAASAASRPISPKPRATFNSGFLDQILVWLAGFLPAPAPAERSRQEKSETAPTGATLNPTGTSSADSPVSLDRGAMIDPNGGW